MPKSRTYGTSFDNGPTDVLVGWNKANSSHTKTDDGLSGQVSLGLADQTEDQAKFYVVLDRVGINRLIRDLRKARDDAYGADA